jgi:hypothetical protein
LDQRPRDWAEQTQRYLEASEEVVDEELGNLMSEHEERVREKDIEIRERKTDIQERAIEIRQRETEIRERETEMRQLEDRNHEVGWQVQAAQARAAELETTLDHIMAWVAAGGIAAPPAADNHFTITDSGRRNLPKLSGTRTQEAVNTFITALERQFCARNAELRQ